MIQALEGYTVSQLLREDDEFLLQRATRQSDGLAVLLLRARDVVPAALAMLEHELSLGAELDAAWSARPLELLHTGESMALVLSDPGGSTLEAILAQSPGQPMAPAAFLPLACALAQALAQLHRCDIVHKHLCPGHVLVGADGVVRLTGFGTALRLRVLPRAPEAQASGSPAYMAPEQTGRTNRAIDTRADLYSLGVLLYQMLCGELPFAALDAMHWIHHHVAREPEPPHLRRKGVDPLLSAIVTKLLAKSPEQRYQTAAGVLADVRHCLSMLATQGRIKTFALACHDGAARLQIPQALVGRAAQLAALEEAARHVAGGGKPELVMVAGEAGTGKSVLLAALRASDALARALVVTARFDQHHHDIPYFTLAQAMRTLVRGLPAQGEPVLARWRRALVEALGPNARLMLDLIPELALVIGDQPTPAALPPLEAQVRLQAVFRQFVGTLAASGSMLVLCLDDVQWVDPASLKLLSHLVTHEDVRRVLVVGAYRSSDVGPTHPLMQGREALRERGTGMQVVTLRALEVGEAAQLVAAALDCPPSQCEPLSALVYAKAGGNPYFTLQFLARLVENGLLRFSQASGRWSFDAQAISKREFSDNVVDLMIGRLQQLPYNTLELLKLLACLGDEAELDAIAHVAGMSAVETDECLWPAARLGLVMREPGAYRFMHGRVHEAAYSLIARSTLPERHLHIGRQLEQQAAGDPAETALFAILGHLNRAHAAMESPAERLALARMNARAGARARQAVAYDAARHFYTLAAAMTPESAWQDAFEPTFALHAALAESEYLCGSLARADELYAQLADQARSRLEVAQVTLLRTALYQVSGRFELAAAVALETLALFGITFPQDEAGIADALAAERSAVARNMDGRTVAGLLDEPASTDPEIGIAAELLAEMGSSVFSARPSLYPLLAVKSLNFTLRFGRSPASCITYSRYAILLVSLGALAEAFAFSALALSLAERDGAAARRIGRLRFVHGAYVHCWRQPIAHSVEQLEQAFQLCQEAGDLPHAGYAAHIATWHRFESGAPLAEVQQRARHYQVFAHYQNNRVLTQLLRCYEQLTLCLQGATGSEGSFDDERFKAAEAMAVMDLANFGAARARFHLMRQIAAYTFGHMEEALQAARAAAADAHFFLASVNESTHHFYHALTLAALYGGLPHAEQAAAMAALLAMRDKLAAWAQDCPANFAHRQLLVDAEIARINGGAADALHAYGAALASARAGGFVQIEALAAELAADFHARCNEPAAAIEQAALALAAYARWGAQGKVRSLLARYPGLRAAERT